MTSEVPEATATARRGRPSIAVLGAINMDLVGRVARLPAPGETVLGADLERHPGGKGANQAVAAARLGAAVRLIGCVGSDGFGDEMLAGLEREGVATAGVRRVPGPTGVALIAVAAGGDNQIVVCAGANARVEPADVVVDGVDAVLCQLEVPMAAVVAAAERAPGLFCLNAAPAAPLPDAVLGRADLVVVNQTERAGLAGIERARLVAVTLGPEGAVLLEGGREVARARPPAVRAVDAVGAGDAFCAALVVGLVEGLPRGEALARACLAGAIAVTRPGAQPSLPTRAEVDRWASGQTGS